MAFGRAWLITERAFFNSYRNPADISPIVWRLRSLSLDRTVAPRSPFPRSSRVTTDEAFNAFSIRSTVNPAYRDRRKEFTSYEEVSLSLSLFLSLPVFFFFSFHRLGSALNFDRLSRIFVRRLLLRGKLTR